ncbi:MAG: ABC transporter ATP-binding protein [Ruminococcaceae bacterium]|nr:ABC transporter ATP-binding protein [Oscillospiraceae bacterium]
MKLAKYLKPYTLFAIISPLLMMGEVLADLCLPYLMSFIVDYGIAEDGLAKIGENAFALGVMNTLFGAGQYTQLNIILTFGIMMLTITLVGGFFGTFCAYAAARASQGFGNDLRCDAYRRVMSLSIEQTDKFTTGSLVTRMTGDIAMLVEFVEMILRMFVRAPMFLIGGTIMLLSLNIKFGTVLLCALPVLLITIVLVLRRAVPMYSIVQKKLDRVNAVVQENVSGARVVKAYVREDYETDRFGRANGELRDVNYSVLRMMSVLHPVMNIVQNLAILAIIALGGVAISEGVDGMSTGTLMAGVNYVTTILHSVMMVTMMFQSVSRAMASGKRVREVLDTVPVISDGTLTEGEDADVAVSFRNVSFRYPGTTGRPVLKNINLDVRRGETLAIIGATGSGKTSLVNLIPRFYDPTEGEVYVDGVPVKQYKLSALRRKLGFVMQKSELFSDTIGGNIRWGRKDASLSEVQDAVATAQAAEFIEGFAEGYDTFVAEKGASLSGGQKQRMSITRALVRRPEIMILDDATSALDLATEAKLRTAMRESLKDTTVIMVAQRIASVKHADRIAVIESDGSILHCAPHEELLRVSPTYLDIVNSQAGQGGAAQ